MLTDSVQAVLDLNQDDIEPTPNMETDLNTDFIKGMWPASPSLPNWKIQL